MISHVGTQALFGVPFAQDTETAMLKASLRVCIPILIGLGTVTAGVTYAGSLNDPRETPILTISGKIENFNKGDTAQFDRAMLEALGLVKIETTTPWHTGPTVFEGVSLDRLMQEVGAKGDRVTAIALNDYSTE